MSLEEIYYGSQIVAAFAILFSLIYLAAQTRHNTDALRVASFRSAKLEFNSLNAVVAQSEELARIYEKASLSYDGLTAIEKSRICWLWLSYTNIFDTLFHEIRSSAGHQAIWEAEQRSLKATVGTQGYREWWRENKLGGTREFRKYLDKLIADEESRAAAL